MSLCIHRLLGYNTPDQVVGFLSKFLADRLLRLPMWCGLEDHQEKVVDAVNKFA